MAMAIAWGCRLLGTQLAGEGRRPRRGIDALRVWAHACQSLRAAHRGLLSPRTGGEQPPADGDAWHTEEYQRPPAAGVTLAS